MNEKLKNLKKKQFEKCLITLEMLTFATPKKYTAFAWRPLKLTFWKLLTCDCMHKGNLWLGSYTLEFPGVKINVGAFRFLGASKRTESRGCGIAYLAVNVG